MLTDSRLKFFITFLFTSSLSFGQFNTNSVYSRYGLGDIIQTGLVQNKALGGLSVCIRQSNQINYLNPASYNSQDSMSFLWDIGMLINFQTASDNNCSSRNKSLNFDHLALAFPVTKRNFISLGVVPYSIMGYNTIIRQQKIQGYVNNSFSGSGKINRFYLGQAFGLFKNHLNFGLNFSYIFGSFDRNESIEYFDYYSNIQVPGYLYLNSYSKETNNVNGFNINLGVQGYEELSKGVTVTGGFTFEPKNRLKLDYSNYSDRYFDNKKGLINSQNKTDTSLRIMMPVRIGLGAAINIREKLLIGIDYIAQNWNNTKFINQEESFKRIEKTSIGVQFSPNCLNSTNYLKKITYRIGGYFNNTYLIYNNIPIREYVLSFGAGLPFKNSGTMFNFAVEIGNQGEKSDKLVNINFTRISLGLILYDSWFVTKK
jgi:hypothetical protein